MTQFYFPIFLKYTVALSGLILLFSGWLLASETPVLAAVDLVFGVVIISIVLAGEVSRRWPMRRL